MTEAAIPLSVVIPFRNAREDAAANLERLHAYLSSLGQPFEILAVDDGSQDGTCGALALKARELGAIRVLRSRERLGKGACLGEAMRAARGERLVFIDGDLAF